MTTEPHALIELEHRKIMTDVKLGKWLAAALDDPSVCQEMKDDIQAWFSSGEPMAAP